MTRVGRNEISDGHGHRDDPALGVPMPDHAHLMSRPRERTPGMWWDLSMIMEGIKGACAQRINQIMGSQGSVWQNESFDRIVRDEGGYQEEWCRMGETPLRSALVEDPDAYPFFVQPPCGSDS
jgi:REP-associated tyrosine transposase